MYWVWRIHFYKTQTGDITVKLSHSVPTPSLSLLSLYDWVKFIEINLDLRFGKRILEHFQGRASPVLTAADGDWQTQKIASNQDVPLAVWLHCGLWWSVWDTHTHTHKASFWLYAALQKCADLWNQIEAQLQLSDMLCTSQTLIVFEAVAWSPLWVDVRPCWREGRSSRSVLVRGRFVCSFVTCHMRVKEGAWVLSVRKWSVFKARPLFPNLVIELHLLTI